MNVFPNYHEFLLENIFNLKIIYNENLFENNDDLDVVLTKHGTERTNNRYNEKINIPKSLIDKVVTIATPKILKYSDIFKKFVIHDQSTQLNVVGELDKTSNQLKFYVATVMYKAKYIPKNQDDKFILVSLNKN